MKSILNLALKKDVFEALQNGTTKEILIEKSNWWKKRLMDLDTGRFKQFDIACISSGSSDKVNYDIEKIELKDNTFVITIKQDVGEVIEPTIINPEKLEPVTVNPVTVETGEDGEVIIKQTYVKPISEITQKIILNGDGTTEGDEEGDKESTELPADTNTEVPEDKDIKEVITNIFNKFCELSDVFVVNMPYVTIRTNGHIIGTNRRLIADRDNDVRFTFNVKELTKYPSDTNSYFALLVLGYINKLLKGNYVFVNKSASGFKEDEWGNITFKIVATAKKKYIFPKQ